MKVKINENFGNVAQNYLFSDIGKRVRAYQESHPQSRVIRMGIGDVTLPLAPCVVEAMKSAADEMGVKSTFRGYAPEYGYDFLRSAICRRYAAHGVTVAEDTVFVSDGAKSDVGNIVDIFGDNEVVITDPVYPVYLDSNILSGRRVRFVEANEANGFSPSPDGLDGEGYVIYLCSPNNPTGTAMTRGELGNWVDFALRTGSVIIYDSAYEAFISDDSPHTVYEIAGAERCAIEICSMSKTAGFTGTRCAWTIVPHELIVSGTELNWLWSRRQATKFNGVAYVIQRAAEAALSDRGRAECMQAVAYYMENARILAGALKKKNVPFWGGVNSPYLWLKCPMGMSSWKFFDFLLEKAELVGTPGSGFGKCGEGYFRLTSFSDRENTAEAAERLEHIL